MAVIVSKVRIGTSGEKLRDQCDVAGARGEHQRRRTTIALVIDAVEVALLQHCLHRPLHVGPQEALAYGSRCTRRASHRVSWIVCKAGNFYQVRHAALIVELRVSCQQPIVVGQQFGRPEVGLGEGLDIGSLTVPERIVEQRLLGLGRWIVRIERFRQPLTECLARPRSPWRGLGAKELFPDGFGLFLLALKFQLARLKGPFVLAGSGGPRRCGLGTFLQVEQPQERVLGIRLDQRQAFDRARHGDVEGVDIELVQFERLVGLVPRPTVFEFVASEIGWRDIPADFGKGRAIARDEVEQDDIGILQPFGLVDRKDQGGPEPFARRRLVFIPQYDDRIAHGGP